MVVGFLKKTAARNDVQAAAPSLRKATHYAALLHFDVEVDELQRIRFGRGGGGQGAAEAVLDDTRYRSVSALRSRAGQR